MFVRWMVFEIDRHEMGVGGRGFLPNEVVNHDDNEERFFFFKIKKPKPFF